MGTALQSLLRRWGEEGHTNGSLPPTSHYRVLYGPLSRAQAWLGCRHQYVLTTCLRDPSGHSAGVLRGWPAPSHTLSAWERTASRGSPDGPSTPASPPARLAREGGRSHLLIQTCCRDCDDRDGDPDPETEAQDPAESDRQMRDEETRDDERREGPGQPLGAHGGQVARAPKAHPGARLSCLLSHLPPRVWP